MRLSPLFFSFFAIAAGATACADPQAGFDAFNQRYTTDKNATGGSTTTTTSSGDAGACMAPAPGAIDGNYYWTLSAKVDPGEPMVFMGKLTTAKGSSGLTWSANLQALSAHDRKTPVGPTVAIGPFDVASDGTFDAMLPQLTVTAAANPLVNSDLVAQVNLIGSFCPPPGFYCGQMTGSVSKPIAISDLTGSTFTLQLITDPNNLPAPLLDCAKDPAMAPTM